MRDNPATDPLVTAERPHTKPPKSPAASLPSDDAETIRSLLEDSRVDETQMCALLENRELPGRLLAEIAKRRKWRASYRVSYALAAHPHTPPLTAIRLLRELQCMDLIRITRLPTASGELRRLAEEQVLLQLPHLPLGQRLAVARRGPARVAGQLIVQGLEQVSRVALKNPFLTEAHLLKSLANDTLPARILDLIASHPKWSRLSNVRVALLKHLNFPGNRVTEFVAALTQGDLEGLQETLQLPETIQKTVRDELLRRSLLTSKNTLLRKTP
jgi:hypothetical protein